MESYIFVHCLVLSIKEILHRGVYSVLSIFGGSYIFANKSGEMGFMSPMSMLFLNIFCD